MTDPLIITCAITGAETSKKNQPGLPVTPREQADAVVACVDAGARIIHLHVRDDEGNPTQDSERFSEVFSLIRKQAPDVIVQFSTGGAIGVPIEARLSPLALVPDMASLNMGSLNFGDDVFVNQPRDILVLANEMKQRGIVPELEIYEAGMLEYAATLIKAGKLPAVPHLQFVLGVPGGMSGELSNLLHLLNLARTNIGRFHWGVAGIGRCQLPLATHAMLLGGHVRVGFEDNIYYRKGELAASNAQLVARIARLAVELGRNLATFDDARKIIGLR